MRRWGRRLNRQRNTFDYAGLLWAFAVLSASVALGEEQRPGRDEVLAEFRVGESGTPFLRHFSPREIGSGPYVHDAIRGLDGQLYLAATRSIAIYDGAQWRHVRTGTPRRMAVDATGRIWVGCSGDLGFLEWVGTTPQYISLRDRLPEGKRPTEEVLETLVLGDAVVFVYGHMVVHVSVDGEGVQTLESYRLDSPPLQAAVVHDGRLVVHRTDLGLMVWGGPSDGTRWIPAPGGKFTDTEGRSDDGALHVRDMLSMDDGSMDEGILLGTDAGTLHRWDGAALRPWSPGAEQRLAGRAVWELGELSDGRVSLASRNAGMMVLTPSGHVEAHWTTEDGLPGDDIQTVIEDDQGALWLGLSPGLVRVSDLPLTFYGDLGEGSVSMLGLVRHGGRLYVGGVEGGFRLEPGVGSEPARLAPLAGEVTALTNWASTPHGLLASGREGLYAVDGLRKERLAPGEQAIVWDDALGGLVAAESSGSVRFWRPEGQGATKAWNSLEYPGILGERIFEIVRDPHAFWLISYGSRTLYRLTFPQGPEDAPHLQSFEMTHPWPRPLWVDGALRMVDRDRVIHWDEARQALVEDPRFDIASWRPPGVDRYEIKSLGNGDLWVGMRDRLRKLDRRPDGTFQPGDLGVGLSAQLTYDMHADPEKPDVLWLATAAGLARLDTQGLEVPRATPRIHVLPPEGASTQADGEADDGDEHAELVVPHSSGALRFEVSVPFYREERLNEFQFRVAGFSDAWSEWTDEPVKEYTNLAGGDYRFEVRARHAGQVLGTSSLAFQVLPPWHQTWWARLGYGLMFLGLVWASVAVQQKRLKRERALAEYERTVNQRLRALDKLKDEFLASTSHELRTPLYGIAGLAESLADGVHGDLPEAARKDLTMLMASSRRLSMLVDDILDFTQLEHRDLELSKGPVDLHALVDVVLALARPLIRQRPLVLQASIDEDLPRVEADENRLHQVLHNLVDNAIKFTPEGKVQVSAEVRGHEVWVFVKDTGYGIPPEQQSQIFEAFSQGQAALEAGVRGTGLGLAISRRLVELHGGVLDIVQSTPQGTTFGFSLPVAKDVVAEDGRPLEETRPSKVPTPVSTQPPRAVPERVLGVEESGPLDDLLDSLRQHTEISEQATILVVDDESVNRLVASNHLASSNYEVLEAQDGPTALGILEKRLPDLILLDVMMPKMSGYEVCRRIRWRHSLHQLPILFLTAKTQPDDLVAAHAAGANDFLTKPVSKPELMSRVETHLQLARMHHRLESLVEERTAQIKVLQGILPICVSCKKIRDDQGSWNEVSTYISNHSEAELSHGCCPECFKRLYPYLEVPSLEV